MSLKIAGFHMGIWSCLRGNEIKDIHEFLEEIMKQYKSHLESRKL